MKPLISGPDSTPLRFRTTLSAIEAHTLLSWQIHLCTNVKVHSLRILHRHAEASWSLTEAKHRVMKLTSHYGSLLPCEERKVPTQESPQLVDNTGHCLACAALNKASLLMHSAVSRSIHLPLAEFSLFRPAMLLRQRLDFYHLLLTYKVLGLPST